MSHVARRKLPCLAALEKFDVSAEGRITAHGRLLRPAVVTAAAAAAAAAVFGAFSRRPLASRQAV